MSRCYLDTNFLYVFLRRALRAMVQDEEPVGPQGDLGVRLPLIVAKLNLEGTIQQFHDGADLPAHQAMLR